MARNLNGSINKMTIVGRLGQDPEFHGKDNGISVLNLATSSGYIDKEQNKVETTQWHRVVVYQPALAKVIQSLEKGDQVYIEGRLETRTYTGKDDIERHSTEVIVDESGVFQILNRVNKKPRDEQSYAPAKTNESKATPAPKANKVEESPKPEAIAPAKEKQAPQIPPPSFDTGFDDDIPF